MLRRVNAHRASSFTLFVKQIHSRAKNDRCKTIFDNTSDRLRSYSFSLAYLLFFTWRVIGQKNIRDVVWLKPPFATLNLGILGLTDRMKIENPKLVLL